ncbi:MAG: SurA N-terminal domain-containing protein [Bacteroidota bacterium]|nr:SurA N-terminal domain-containing protein [Bacteroidota bacterium]MDP4234268.1 SurA N-terminal domain-containing protein [Bacteroidota bacterium]MDP4243458.1 SurA N-terminal domain-containing protein [Bacteroidota bacterium]MDP4289160.1 SurA N-terminal domain-containing protein [Bacteroidota bacterium]
MKRTLFLCLLLTAAFTVRALAQSSDSSRLKKVTRVKKSVSHALGDTVGVVNGVVITYGDFKSLLSGTIHEYVTRTSEHIITDSAYSLLIDTAWNKAVDDIIEEREIERRKLSLNDSELRAMVIEHPPDFLRTQFTDSTGTFHREILSNAMNDRRNDTVVAGILASERIRLETNRLIAAVTTKAKTEAERGRMFHAWLRRMRAEARIIDRRLNFGFY